MYYPCNEIKGADQLSSYCEADLRHCFRIGKNLFFHDAALLLSDNSPTTKKRSSSVTLTKPRSLTQESLDRKLERDKETPSSPSDGPTMRMKKGRQPALGPDTKIFVIWLENFEDHENFPAGM